MIRTWLLGLELSGDPGDPPEVAPESLCELLAQWMLEAVGGLLQGLGVYITAQKTQKET